MVINNFDKIKGLLEFEEGKFYNLQILRRRKDGNTFVGSNLVKSYVIDSWEKLLSFKQEIVSICNALNARAYIDVCRRDFRTVAHQLNLKNTELFYKGNYEAMGNTYLSVAMKYRDNEMWVVDIDTLDEGFINEVVEKVNSCRSKFSTVVEKIIPTVSGVHLITHPFNRTEFATLYEKTTTDIVTVHKCSMTLLYFDSGENPFKRKPQLTDFYDGLDPRGCSGREYDDYLEALDEWKQSIEEKATTHD